MLKSVATLVCRWSNATHVVRRSRSTRTREVAHRVDPALAEVVGAVPHQLHRLAERLRHRRRLERGVGEQVAAERAAALRHVHGDCAQPAGRGSARAAPGPRSATSGSTRSRRGRLRTSAMAQLVSSGSPRPEVERERLLERLWRAGAPESAGARPCCRSASTSASDLPSTVPGPQHDVERVDRVDALAERLRRARRRRRRRSSCGG